MFKLNFAKAVSAFHAKVNETQFYNSHDEYDAAYPETKDWVAAGSPTCLIVQKDFQLEGNRVLFCLGGSHGGAYLIFPAKEEGSYDYWKQRYVEEPFIYKDHYIIYDERSNVVNVYKLVKVEV